MDLLQDGDDKIASSFAFTELMDAGLEHPILPTEIIPDEGVEHAWRNVLETNEKLRLRVVIIDDEPVLGLNIILSLIARDLSVKLELEVLSDEQSILEFAENPTDADIVICDRDLSKASVDFGQNKGTEIALALKASDKIKHVHTWSHNTDEAHRNAGHTTSDKMNLPGIFTTVFNSFLKNHGLTALREG